MKIKATKKGQISLGDNSKNTIGNGNFNRLNVKFKYYTAGFITGVVTSIIASIIWNYIAKYF